MQVAGSVALVTGANRGLGTRFVAQLLERGATKVYAAARRPESLRDALEAGGDGRVQPLALDLLDADGVAAAAVAAPDVTLLVNNAGVSTRHDLVRGDLAEVRREMDTNFFGTLAVTRAFADTLGAHGGGGIVNVLSALSFVAFPGATSYSASKAAEWMLTQGTRVELAGQGTQVLGLHLGGADTDMMAGYDGPLLDPAEVVRAALDGLEAGRSEVLVDPWSAEAKAGAAEDPDVFYARLAQRFA
ncbi:SDR family oxidoreductase [Microlunatus flavus]|uniref:Short-chain dehydrogenase n=1 Tax=Microlunatus flavus TaxID=1036181 RepID=A0A1H9I315_9ACTN|nr:SDR family oxidoreductase [Microlunatus flavus]SEQ68927.1 Short-chain dehydrogenase [Microlunatus flavus]